MEILSRCGFRCDLCAAYNPNIKSFEDRKIVSAKWQQYFGFYLEPEKIGCDGCVGNSPTLDANCPIRPCLNERQLENCAYCPDFDCEKIKSRMDALVDWQDKLDEIPKEDYELFIKPYESRKRLTEIRKKIS